MYDMKYITHRLNEGNVGSETYCEPEPLARALWERMPESIKPLFNPPRGAKIEGEYVGSVIQVAKGTMKRLHGPEFEMLASNILSILWSLDDSQKEKKKKKLSRNEDPSIVTYEGVQRRWDVRRYSSSRDSQGRWQTLPDFSYYIGCSASEYSNKMRKKPATTDTTTTTTTEWK